MSLNKRDFEVFQMIPSSDFPDLESNGLITSSAKPKFTWFIDKKKSDDKYRNFGRSWVFCFYNSEPLISIGPHWYLFLFMFIVGFCLQAFLNHIVLDEFPKSFSFFPMCISYLVLASYFITAVKNPGIYQQNMMVIDSQGHKNFCPKCNIIASKDTLHCDDCEVCVVGFDHHCPWVGKCVGRGNLYCFYIFIITTLGYFVLLIGEILFFFYSH